MSYKYENNRFVRFAYKFRYFDYSSLKSFVKFWILFFGIIIFIILNVIQVIQIRIFAGTQTLGFLWLILNALVWNVYLNALGIFNAGIKRKTWKYIILIIAVLIIVLGFGYFDVVVRINLWILLYKQYSTGSVDGIFFFWYNVYLWIPFYFITFLIESEITVDDWS